LRFFAASSQGMSATCPYRDRFLFVCVILVLVSACSPQNAAPTPTEDSAVLALLGSVTAVPTADLVTPVPSLTHTPEFTFTPAPTLTETITATPAATNTPEPPAATSTPVATLPPTATLTPTITPTLPAIDHYRMSRPIARSDKLVDWVDRTYPYGSTQSGARQVHTGVDFFNLRLTPVLAAADGKVIFAGSDVSTLIGPANDYYGNVVIIQHDFLSPQGLPVFTLYGHLQELNVEAGQQIFAGEKIGSVGDSGIAIGPHLHFEVRVGDGYDFYSTQNPELWIEPYQGFGTLAGWVAASDGELVAGRTVLVRSGNRTREAYIYVAERVNSDPVWNENFTLGDLPAGSYDVIFSDNGNVRFRQTITIRAGQTTFVTMMLP
jgi:murein DD-endopeptidase MepM/ murein hydrolase activator NlpD